MGDDLFADARLYDYLLVLDRELSERARHAGCPRCAGRLHSASYPRKPRGGPRGAHARRFSLCCARCRKRVTPPSVRFLGRRVYYGVVVVLVRSPWWRTARARFLPPLEDQRLPGALLARFEAPEPMRRMADLLAFLAPLSVVAGHVG
jgi:hypothetical protein